MSKRRADSDAFLGGAGAGGGADARLQPRGCAHPFPFAFALPRPRSSSASGPGAPRAGSRGRPGPAEPGPTPRCRRRPAARPRRGAEGPPPVPELGAPARTLWDPPEPRRSPPFDARLHGIKTPDGGGCAPGDGDAGRGRRREVTERVGGSVVSARRCAASRSWRRFPGPGPPGCAPAHGSARRRGRCGSGAEGGGVSYLAGHRRRQVCGSWTPLPAICKR